MYKSFIGINTATGYTFEFDSTDMQNAQILALEIYSPEKLASDSTLLLVEKNGKRMFNKVYDGGRWYDLGEYQRLIRAFAGNPLPITNPDAIKKADFYSQSLKAYQIVRGSEGYYKEGYLCNNVPMCTTNATEFIEKHYLTSDKAHYMILKSTIKVIRGKSYLDIDLVVKPRRIGRIERHSIEYPLGF